MNILFTICGRAGSKGFKNKNLKRMNGVPLVYYTLAAIELYIKKNPNDIVTIALNTDSQPLTDMVKSQKVIDGILCIPRKEELAGDKVAKVDVIRDTFREVRKAFEVIIDLDITSPLRRVEDVENIIKVYKSNDELELVTSVVHARRSPYFNMVENKGGCYRKICESGYTTRQEAPASYELNASIYAYKPGFLDIDIADTILDHKCGISVMEDYLVLDIDSEEDFQMMEVLHRYYLEHNEGLRKVYEESKLFLDEAEKLECGNERD